jgi:predicted phosphodiesterase
MVRRFQNFFLVVLLLSIFPLAGCENDLFGFFASTDLDERWQARDTFNFLSYADRNISLGDDYSFIVLNDTHILNGNGRGLEKLKDVMGRDSNIKFVVFNGDITQNGKREDIEKFISVAGSLGVPCYPAVGNHDVYFGNWPIWKDLIGSTCYRINGGSTTLLILDSANAYFGVKQLDWLENELRNAVGRVFIFTHINMFVGSPDMHQFTDVRERARVTSLLNGRCDVMFSGHAHKRIIREAGGVKYITVEDYRDNEIYCQVWVSKDGIRWEFKKL